MIKAFIICKCILKTVSNLYVNFEPFSSHSITLSQVLVWGDLSNDFQVQLDFPTRLNSVTLLLVSPFRTIKMFLNGNIIANAVITMTWNNWREGPMIVLIKLNERMNEEGINVRNSLTNKSRRIKFKLETLKEKIGCVRITIR